MSKVRIVYRSDGGISVIHPAPNSRREKESEAEWLERVFTKAMKYDKGCDYDDIDSSELPQTRKYRDAWTGSKGNGISIDTVKKAEIDARPTKEQEAKIQAEMRKMAMESLVAKGEL